MTYRVKVRLVGSGALFTKRYFDGYSWGETLLQAWLQGHRPYVRKWTYGRTL